ncbi:accessory Sec system protein Asp1 [Leuconostocaceae bacterium ESL0723]|nr:accessory Sec system protein Asp1 [Leuconostocaceae bacterium ESL0723]
MSVTIMPNWQGYLNDVPQMDHSLHQARLFLEKKQAVHFVVRDYLPKLRHILASKQVEAATYWSAFDELQQVDWQDEQPLSLDDFTWPEGVEFVYMYDRVVVMLKQHHYATVWPNYPASDHYDRIDLLEKGQLKQQLTLDDRGFVSRVLTFEGAAVTSVDYLNPSGAVVVHENYADGVVTTRRLSWTDQTKFSNLAVLVDEVVQRYFSQHLELGPVVVDQSLANVQTLMTGAISQPVITSYDSNQSSSTTTVPNQAQVVVTGAGAAYDALNAQAQVPVELVPPFAARVKLGQSNASSALPIYWFIDQVDMAMHGPVMEQLLMLARYTPDLVIICEAKQAPTELQAMVTKAQAEQGDEDLNLTEQFQFLGPQSEEQRQDYFQTVRVLIDLSQNPDQYLQTLALSKGVPQVDAVASPYVQAGQNGQIVKDSAQLVLALNDYLDNINKWAQAQNAAVQLANQFDSDVIWERWQQIFQTLKQSSGDHNE